MAINVTEYSQDGREIGADKSDVRNVVMSETDPGLMTIWCDRPDGSCFCIDVDPAATAAVLVAITKHAAEELLAG